VTLTNKIGRFYFNNWQQDIVSGDSLTFKGTAVTSRTGSATFQLTFTHSAIAVVDPTYEFKLMWHAIIDGGAFPFFSSNFAFSFSLFLTLLLILALFISFFFVRLFIHSSFA
jgi:hypothetical protein